MKKLKDVITEDLKLYPYQIEGIRMALKHRYVICGDQMGLGKTAQGIALSLITESQTVVVCPAYLRINWEREYKKWAKDCPSILVVDTKDLDANLDIFKVIIISYNLLASYPHLLDKRDCILLDEVHYVKSMDTRRWKGLNKYLDENRPNYLFGMSGTPVTKSVIDWYAPLKILAYCPSREPCEENNFSVDHYNGAAIDYFFPTSYAFNTYFSHKRTFKVKNRRVVKWEGLRNLPRLKKLLIGKYFRRLAKDYLELPDIVRKEVIIDMDVDKELERAWELGVISKEATTAKSHSAYLKGKSTGLYVDKLLEAGEGPILIFTDHISPLAEIRSKLKKWKGEIIQGSTSHENRQIIVDKFQGGQLDYLIATIGSTNTGYTLTAARNMVFNDLSWKAHENEQAEKRIHRIGQDKMVTIHRIIKGSVDARIVDILTRKMKEIGDCT